MIFITLPIDMPITVIDGAQTLRMHRGHRRHHIVFETECEGLSLNGKPLSPADPSEVDVAAGCVLVETAAHSFRLEVVEKEGRAFKFGLAAPLAVRFFKDDDRPLFEPRRAS